ncbi:hypothetical protein Mapa_002498 [Marchantia paleacea]|nr:hypothetical protein Mapa_002498 [Marchantia paleacea]
MVTVVFYWYLETCDQSLVQFRLPSLNEDTKRLQARNVLHIYVENFWKHCKRCNFKIVFT